MGAWSADVPDKVWVFLCVLSQPPASFSLHVISMLTLSPIRQKQIMWALPTSSKEKKWAVGAGDWTQGFPDVRQALCHGTASRHYGFQTNYFPVFVLFCLSSRKGVLLWLIKTQQARWWWHAPLIQALRSRWIWVLGQSGLRRVPGLPGLHTETLFPKKKKKNLAQTNQPNKNKNTTK